MYKIFHGFALVEAYQNLKKAKRLAENKSVSRFVKLAIAIVVSLVLWCLPIEIFGVEGLTVIEQRLISIFIFATFMYNPQNEAFAIPKRSVSIFGPLSKTKCLIFYKIRTAFRWTSNPI